MSPRKVHAWRVWRERFAPASREDEVEKRLMSVKEASEVLAMSRFSVYELVRDGVLPAVRVGRRIRVVKSELDGWIERQRIATEQ